MNILLIQPKMNWAHPYCETPSRALLILGTLAKQAGHEVEIWHRDIEGTPSTSPDIIGITCNTFQVKDAIELVNRYQDCSRIVIGGPHAIAWEKVGGEEVVVGPGERRWCEIIGATHDQKWVTPDYSLVDLKRFNGVHPIGATPSIAIMASRGCPGECTFCNTPLFWGKKVEYRPPQDVVSEISMLHNMYGVKEIFFQDDTFNINHNWASEIFERIIAEKLNAKILFKCCFRANEKLVTKELLDLASRAGVWNIFYGLESGSQYMLDRMKKHITVDESRRALSMTTEAGIRAQVSFVIGMPGETTETLKETCLFIEEVIENPGVTYGWCPACPFPGTELDREVMENGHKADVPYEEYHYGMVLCRTEELSMSFFNTLAERIACLR